MPLFIVNTNVTASKEQKSQLAGAITEVVVKALKVRTVATPLPRTNRCCHSLLTHHAFRLVLQTSTSHVHVHIKDDVFFSFGGDAEAPAAHVSAARHAVH